MQLHCSFFSLNERDFSSKTSAYLLKLRQGGGVSDGGGRVGHGAHQGHPSSQSCCCTRGEVLLMCGTRLPQVHVHVD